MFVRKLYFLGLIHYFFLNSFIQFNITLQIYTKVTLNDLSSIGSNRMSDILAMFP